MPEKPTHHVILGTGGSGNPAPAARAVNLQVDLEPILDRLGGIENSLDLTTELIGEMVHREETPASSAILGLSATLVKVSELLAGYVAASDEVCQAAVKNQAEESGKLIASYSEAVGELKLIREELENHSEALAASVHAAQQSLAYVQNRDEKTLNAEPVSPTPTLIGAPPVYVTSPLILTRAQALLGILLCGSQTAVCALLMWLVFGRL